MAAESVLRTLEAFASRSVLELTQGVHSRLTRNPADGGTPIDTSWASSNWTPQIGTTLPPRAPRPARDQAIAGAQANRDANRSRLEQLAATYRIELGSTSVVNSAPYIGPLNNGSSPQGAAFVERAILEQVAETSRNVRSLSLLGVS